MLNRKSKYLFKSKLGFIYESDLDFFGRADSMQTFKLTGSRLLNWMEADLWIDWKLTVLFFGLHFNLNIKIKKGLLKSLPYPDLPTT